MLPADAMAIRDKRADAAVLQPPNLGTLGALTFTSDDREALNTWLAQDGWPRGGMDLIMLEGYLIGLLAWPVRVQPGAWLPPIWGQNGWKLPPEIDSQSSYRRFIELVVGFLVNLDRGLCDRPAYFMPALPAPTPDLRRRTAPAVSSWAQGFLKALQFSAEGLGTRSNSARLAVTQIARCASSVASPNKFRVQEEIASAVLTLAAERVSRGPLGAFAASESFRVARRRVGQ
jgi:yecA family protein